MKQLKGEFEFKRKNLTLIASILMLAVVPAYLIKLMSEYRITAKMFMAFLVICILAYIIFIAFFKFGHGTYETKENVLLVRKGTSTFETAYSDIDKAHSEIAFGRKKNGGVIYRMTLNICLKNGKMIKMQDYHIPDNEAQDPRSSDEVFETHRFTALDRYINSKMA